MKANVFRISLFLVFLTLFSGSLSTFAQAPRQYEPPAPPEILRHERSDHRSRRTSDLRVRRVAHH